MTQPRPGEPPGGHGPAGGRPRSPLPPPSDPFLVPPDRPAQGASPYPGPRYGGDPPTVPTGGPPAPPGPPAGGAAWYPPRPPRRRRGLLILAIAAAAVLVLGAGAAVGGWLLLRDPDRDGPPTPVDAVHAFLQAVYHDQDPAAAAALVCSEARDEQALADQVAEIRSYEDSYLTPRFSWTPPEVVEEGDGQVVMAVTITVTTGDEQTAEQVMHLTVLDKERDGWWVCDLETLPADSEPDEPAE